MHTINMSLALIDVIESVDTRKESKWPMKMNMNLKDFGQKYSKKNK